jgi:hypothetical protein
MAEQIEREIREYFNIMKSITIEEAVTVIQNGLLNDPGYRMGWTANIADGFQGRNGKRWGAFSK